ncbi:MAG: sigma-54-dependent Fis family transcriptional regulator [Planctomycetes bacterium]|nr:sigma-54-dependent Fis family transcriptional regulator [Planctomycetota bacterium]
MPRKVQPVRANGERPHVLVIDNDPEICRCLERCLALLECDAESCTAGAAGIAKLEQERFHVVITDLAMPGMNGIEVVRAVRRVAPGTPPIVLTGHATIASAVEAVQAGAADYLTKPFKLEDIRMTIDKALRPPPPAAEPVDAFAGGLVGRSQSMMNLRAQIEQVAIVASTVLIHGETGVGKELVAKAIHGHSERRMRPFVAVNCGAIDANLLSNELFGHEKEGFTGAEKTKPGHIEAAGQGTLFLDEISETSPSFQTALLRVLQEREIVRVGGVRPVKVGFRLIAATNKDLAGLVKEAKFRQDLYYRLNVVSLTAPPLREHPEDIPELVEHFIRKHQAAVNKKISGINPQAMALLTDHTWPGNIRQLEHTIERAMVLTTGSEIEARDLPAEVTCCDDPADPASYFEEPFREAKNGFERAYLETVLRQSNGNVSEAARRAEVARPYFHQRIRKYAINPDQFRNASP